MLTKINGNKQVSHLTMFDYIVSITIGSIAAELATELERPLKPLIAMLIYGICSIAISIATQKSIHFRRLVFGKSKILMRNGKLYRNNLKKAKLDINEFLMQARTQGYFDISAINTAVLEPSGSISFLPFSQKRPVTCEDLKALPQTEDVFYNVIMDGKIMQINLKSAGKDERWLKNELKVKGIKDINKIFLATLDINGKLNTFESCNKIIDNDYFQ